MAQLIKVKVAFEVLSEKMGSTSTDSAGDEEFMEDLITLAPLASGDSDCEIVSVLENKSRPEIKKKPHSDAQKKQRTQSSYGKGDFYLPARFFDITKNTSLLSRCRALSVCIVDCGKFPWYYKNKCGIRKPRPKSKQIFTLHNLLEDMSFEQKLKQQKYKNKCTDVVGKVNLTPSKDPSSVDFKKNIGLVGLKIERKLVGLVFDENTKEDKKNKKHSSDKQKNKTLEGKETKNDKGNSLSSEKNKVNKIFAKGTSLKCSLNINPVLSPCVQQKLLEIVSKSVQSTSSTSVNAVQLLSSDIDTYNNTTIIGQTVKYINENSTKVSTNESISGIETPKLNIALDKNTLPSNQPAIINNNIVVENEISKEAIPEKSDSKKGKKKRDEEIKPEEVRKSEPEIKQELKDEDLVPDNSLNPTISVTNPILEVAPMSPLTNLRSFRRSIENSAPTDPNQDVREFVGQSIPVQTTTVSNENIVNYQWHRYNEAGLHTDMNYQQNNNPPYNMTMPPMQPNVNNLQVTHQNIVGGSTQPRIGDLKIQTVSQINNRIATPEIPRSEEVHNALLKSDVQNNEHQFHRNDLIAQSTARQSEKNKPGSQISLLKNAQGKKTVRVKKAYLMKNQNRYVAVGPYTVPPYQQYGYQPRMRPSGPAAQWPENTQLANKVPMLMQQLNYKQMPMQPQSFWEPPRTHQDFFQRNVNSNQTQAYDEYYHNNWNRPPRQPPPPYNVERRMNYVPPYARQTPRLPNYNSPNSKPQERGVITRELPVITTLNQVKPQPALSPHTSPGLQSTQCLNYVGRALNTPVPTLPTPSTSDTTNLPILSSQTLTLSVPKPVEEVHTAEILYPNTTFSEESSTSNAIYTEGSNHINVATYKNQQYFEPCPAEINTSEIPQSTIRVPNEVTPTPVKVSKDNQNDATRALDMPDLASVESVLLKHSDAANNALSSQPQDKTNKPAESDLRKHSDATNNVLSFQHQTNNNTPAQNVPYKPNNPANNSLFSQHIAKKNTPEYSNPPPALKQTYQTKNVPKKRVYIPDDDTKTSSFEGNVSSVSERSVPAVLERNVKIGYSPPILPIPTVQKSYEILALVNAMKTPNNGQNNSNNSGPLTPMKQSGYRNNLVEIKSQDVTQRKIKAPICIIENPPIKRNLDQTPQSATKARKISIDEYKKRQDESQDLKNNVFSPTKDKSNYMRFYTNNDKRGVELQDLGYDSDPPSKS